MKITLIRQQWFPARGTLSQASQKQDKHDLIGGKIMIGEEEICDTLENIANTTFLPPGRYSIGKHICPATQRKALLLKAKSHTEECDKTKGQEAFGKASKCLDKHLEAWQAFRQDQEREVTTHTLLPCLCPRIVAVNGVANRTDGIVAVGRSSLRTPELMLQSQENFERLAKRIYNAVLRGEEVEVVIE